MEIQGTVGNVAAPPGGGRAAGAGSRAAPGSFGALVGEGSADGAAVAERPGRVEGHPSAPPGRTSRDAANHAGHDGQSDAAGGEAAPHEPAPPMRPEAAPALIRATAGTGEAGTPAPPSGLPAEAGRRADGASPRMAPGAGGKDSPAVRGAPAPAATAAGHGAAGESPAASRTPETATAKGLLARDGNMGDTRGPASARPAVAAPVPGPRPASLPAGAEQAAAALPRDATGRAGGEAAPPAGQESENRPAAPPGHAVRELARRAPAELAGLARSGPGLGTLARAVPAMAEPARGAAAAETGQAPSPSGSRPSAAPAGAPEVAWSGLRAVAPGPADGSGVSAGEAPGSLTSSSASGLTGVVASGSGAGAATQAAHPATPAAMPQAGGEVARPVAAQVAAAIVAEPGAGRIELRLDPPELGRLEISLEFVDQTLRATVAAERAGTHDLLRRHAELLQMQLQQAGFSGADVRFSGGQRQAAGGWPEGGQPGPGPDAGPETEALAPPARHAGSAPGAGLDLRY